MSNGTQYIEVPYTPSAVQAYHHDHLCKYNVLVWHRGLGKSWFAMHELIRAAFTCDDSHGALFLYVAPEKQQAKDLIWNQFKSFVEYIPDVRIREDELSITFPDNGATIRLEGADRPDRLRGIHPRYVVIDEVGQMKRDLWYEVIYPAVQRNDGKVLFIGTPKGDNLFREVYDHGTALRAGGDMRWFTSYIDIYHSGIYPKDQIESIRQDMPAAKFEQEYLCKWDAIFTGAYYSDILYDETKGVVSDVPYNPLYKVITAWDLGTEDPTAIWFIQVIDGKYHFIDYYQDRGKDFFHYLRILQNKPYVYDYHVMPHDIRQRGWESASSREAIMRRMGFTPVIAKKIGVAEGISMSQAHLYYSRIDRNKCREGISKLAAYRSKMDPGSGDPTGVPDHDANSHAADALRTFFVGVKHRSVHSSPIPTLSWKEGSSMRNKEVVAEYNPFDQSSW